MNIKSSLNSKYTPPLKRPPHECAGYLGYYTRVHLKVAFDLVDLDGCWPAVWVYRKSKNGVVRVFEEKPGCDWQQLHSSELRIFRGCNVFAAHVRKYVIWQADKLAIPEFPITLSLIDPRPSDDEFLTFEKEQFDKWLLCEES